MMHKTTMTMTKTVMMMVFLLAGCSALAQEAPKFEFAAGYNYTNLRPNSGSAGSLNGWNGQAQYNFTRRWSLVADATGSYGSDAFVNETLHTYTLGPRCYFRRSERANVFGHLLLGVGFLRVSQEDGAFARRQDFASQLGGGVDVNLNKRMALRVGQLDYMVTRFAHVTQNNFRFSAGVVLRLGGESTAKK